MTSAEDNKIMRSAYKWNTAAGLLNAFQSVIMLMVLTRVCDVAVAGVFTIGYANGNLFLNLGKYGMRSYQVSDRSERFAFQEYRMSRVFSTAAMIACGLAYIAYLGLTVGYSVEKTAVIVLLLLYEAAAAFEDVFHGNYQQQGRLDVGARMLFLRVVSSIAVFCVSAIVGHSLVMASACLAVWAAAFVAFEVFYVRKRYGLPKMADSFDMRKTGKLLRTCFPLFAAAFLLFYIGNAPKYAIDAIMDDTAQAYYGYIAMPVFVVSLLASLAYNPMVTSLADQWIARDVRAFGMRFIRIGLVIVGITAGCDLAAALVGIPVLNLLYNADLGAYLIELLVLVTGGGFLAIVSLAVLGITIVRFQRALLPAYLLATVVAWWLSDWAVVSWGITGAAWAYFFSMAFLAAVFVVMFAIGVRIQR